MTRHLPEVLIEATLLALFMMSACGFGVLLFHPGSPVHGALATDLARRLVMGAAMGSTSLALVYSPWGQRSGAHLNPAVTLAFLRLGKVSRSDALAYIVAQFTGGVAGVAVSWALLGDVLAHASTRFVATVPGRAGSWAAFAVEIAIAFAMMAVVLAVSSTRHARLTGVCAAVLVAAFIVAVAPISGMSLNPARSFGSAVFAGALAPLWIYFLAPLIGMQLAAVIVPARLRAGCAKLDHPPDRACIFCRRGVPPGSSRAAG
ncbi:MAG TPA: aquaporin [Anaeromyxobacteraceae bacterium]|nr:aquaporin [Anaeromyxobacteraceae bacterium]